MAQDPADSRSNNTGLDAARHLEVACSCGAARYSFSVPKHELPIASHLCSCDTSRRISGSLLTSYIHITFQQPIGEPAPKPDLTALTPYHSSDRLVRHFCSTCGTHMYLEYHDDGHFEAATGTLQVDSTQGVIEYKSCMWLGDARDGGASHWLPDSIDGQEMNRWTGEAGDSDSIPLDHFRPGPEDSVVTTRPMHKPVHAHCHCRGVEFWIKPPGPESEDARSDFPDLMVPYHRGANAAKNSSNEPWWLRDEGKRFLAGTCMCLSCRAAGGFDITFWAFVPNANIFLDRECTKAFPEYGERHGNLYWGTMKSYQSSEGVTRTFCERCGANVFWDGGKGKGREELIDVAVGLLDAKSGARAEELLSWWTERVSFEEDAVNKSLARALVEGLKDWERRRLKDEAPSQSR